jgi:hypothetical protein
MAGSTQETWGRGCLAAACALSTGGTLLVLLMLLMELLMMILRACILHWNLCG